MTAPFPHPPHAQPPQVPQPQVPQPPVPHADNPQVPQPVPQPPGPHPSLAPAPHPQAHPQQPPVPYPHMPQAPVPPGAAVTCRYCGSVPAIKASVYGHQGFVIFMRVLTMPGPYCKSCGIAVCRDVSAKMLWQGWWGFLSMIITPIMLVVNLVNRIRFGSLAEPLPGAPGQPAVPGKPVLMRAAALGLLVPVLAAVGIGWAIAHDPTNADVGTCIRNDGTGSNPDVTVVDCNDSSAQYMIVGKFEDTIDDRQCDQFSGVVASYYEENGSHKTVLCLGEIS